MKYYRFNQIAMAVLGALLLIFGTRTIMQIAFEEHEPEKPGMEVTKKDAAKPGAEDAAGGETELAALLAKGDVAKGETAAAVCKACHAFDAGAASPIGPNLHNVVGRKIASVEGFNYSPALKEKSGEEWTYENLSNFIHNPGQFAPGTIMAFPGLPDAQQRADVILFLRSKTDNPPPLPEAAPAAAAAPEGEAAPTEEAAEAPAGDKNAEVGALVAKADPAKGEQAAAVCKACHTFDKDAPSPIGPNLYGVVGRKIASVEGFNYSPALKEKSGETWDYAHLDAMIHNPMQYAPGTLMAFPGVPDANQRADVIAFLRTKADTPFPLPEEGAAAPAEEKPVEEAPPAAEQEQPAEEAPAGTEEEQPAEEAPPAEAPPAAEEAPAEPPAADEEPAEPAPPVEEEAPAETPAPAPEAPAAEEEPAAETPDVPEADMTPPSTETQPQPVVPEEMEEAPAPAAEPAPAEEPSVAPSEAAPSEDDNLSSQPQPVYPEGAPDAAAPVAPMAPEEAPAPSADDSLSSQLQPVYPEGEPPAATSTSEASGATPAPADLSSQPQPVYPEGPPQ